MRDESPLQIYEEEKKKYGDELGTLKKKQGLLGWLRLGIIIIAAVIAFYLFASSVLWGVVSVITGIGIFLTVVSVDIDNNKKISHLQLLVKINEEEIDSLNGNFAYKYDGVEFLPSLHDYAYDLDIFGKYSLYQLVNRGNTEQGRR